MPSWSSRDHHYPDGAAPDEETLVAVLGDLVDTVRGTGLRALLMGGIGSAALARPRTTDDIDLFVHVDDVDELLDHLDRHGFEVERTDPRWLYKAHRRGVLVDLVFRSSGDIYLDQQVLDHARMCSYKGIDIPAVSPEDLLVIKAVTASEHTAHHWYDALGLVALTELDWDYLLDRARQCAPRRVLSLLLYAESLDHVVPPWVLTELFEMLHPRAARATGTPG
jgi:predicted nucleotidyltransferase